MSKVLKTVGTIAGIVAAVTGNPIAIAIAVTANIGAQLTAKRPPAQGSVNTITIDPNAPARYLIGRTYSGGTLRHDVGYGGKVGKVQNPYRGMVIEYSVCGPVEGLVSMFADFVEVPFSGSAATGYYAGFLYRDYQLGETPEASALSPHWSGMPGWGASSKLSGKPAILWGALFDKDGKKFTSGLPQLGAVWDGVKVYDQREDSTQPGGSGSQRSDDRDTWAFSEWPDDHALTYALGHWYDGKKMFGLGFPVDSIDLPAFLAWGNVCRANGWKVGGEIMEPGDRMANLKRIMAAGSAEPIWSGGMLSVKYDAPRVSLVTITPDDYADGQYRTRGMQSWRDRMNTIVPEYRSPDHKWEYVASDAVTDETYLEEDGEEKIDTIRFELVQDKDQAAQLAAYKLVNGREMTPIERNLKPEFRFYRPGDMVTIDDPEGGLDGQDCVIVKRSVDPLTLAVRWTLMSETTAKHDFALGKTGTAPPTPTLLDPADRDEVAGVNVPPSRGAYVFKSKSPTYPESTNDTNFYVDEFTGVLDDGRTITFPYAHPAVSSLDPGTFYRFFWDFVNEEYVASTDASPAELASPDYAYLGRFATSESGTFPAPPESPPPGWAGDGPAYDAPI